MQQQEKIYCVYKHTNKANGKVYIGQTRNLKDRWSRQGNRYDSCSYFFKAIQKYGWDGFEHEVIEDNLTLEEANEKERYWIQFYDSRNKEKGYNLMEGGNTGPLLAETRQKMSDSRKKYLDKHNIRKAVRCVETGEIFESAHKVQEIKGIQHTQISACCLHYPSAFTAYSFHWVFVEEMPEWTPELAKVKIAEIESLRGGTEEDKQKAHIARVTAKGKKVLCVELNRVFLSAGEAAREFGIDRSYLTKVCRGENKTAKGYHWKYIEEE